MALNYVYNDREVNRLIRRLTPAMRDDVVRAFDKIGFEATRRARARFRPGRTFQAGPTRRGGRIVASSFSPTNRKWMFSRTGTLKRAFGHTVTTGGPSPLDVALVSFNAGVLYAPPQERGSIQRPTRGQHLTVPLDQNLTGRGVPRYPSARALRAQTRGKTSESTFVTKTRSGAKVIGYRRGKLVEFLWVLRRSTTIPPRLGFFEMWQRYFPDARQQMAAAIDRALIKAAGRNP